MHQSIVPAVRSNDGDRRREAVCSSCIFFAKFANAGAIGDGRCEKLSNHAKQSETKGEAGAHSAVYVNPEFSCKLHTFVAEPHPLVGTVVEIDGATYKGKACVKGVFLSAADDVDGVLKAKHRALPFPQMMVRTAAQKNMHFDGTDIRAGKVVGVVMDGDTMIVSPGEPCDPQFEVAAIIEKTPAGNQILVGTSEDWLSALGHTAEAPLVPAEPCLS